MRDFECKIEGRSFAARSVLDQSSGQPAGSKRDMEETSSLEGTTKTDDAGKRALGQLKAQQDKIRIRVYTAAYKEPARALLRQFHENTIF